MTRRVRGNTTRRVGCRTRGELMVNRMSAECWPWTGALKDLDLFIETVDMILK